MAESAEEARISLASGAETGIALRGLRNTNEIKATFGSRTIRATLPDVLDADLESLPGVRTVERRGAGVVLLCSDSDAAIRALVSAFPEARDIEIGVRLGAANWVEMTGYLLVGLIPFAALGILLGHLVTADSVGPVVGGVTALFAFLGGVWFPISQGSALHHVAQLLPSYWLVKASYVGLGASGWGREGWLVIAVWTIVATRLAMRAYARDTGRA